MDELELATVTDESLSSSDASSSSGSVMHENLRLYKAKTDAFTRNVDGDSLAQSLREGVVAAKGAAEELQTRADRQALELQAALGKVGALTNDAARLRHDLAHQLEVLAQERARHKKDMQDTKNRFQEVENAAHDTARRCEALEEERDGLKRKVQSLLSVSQQCSIVGESIEAISSAKFAGTGPLEHKESPSVISHLPKGSISLVKASAARVTALERELTQERKKTASLAASLEAAEGAISAKQSIISKLEQQLSSRFEASGSEGAALKQLSAHTDAMAAELEALKRNTVDPSALEAEKEFRRAAEKRASAAEKDKSRVVAEVESVRRDMDALLRQVEGEDSAKHKVAKLRAALDDARAQHAAAKAQAEVSEGKAADLQERLKRREASLNLAQSRCRSLEANLNRMRQLQGLKAEKARQLEERSRAAEIEASSEVEQLQAQCGDMAAHLQKAVELQEAALAAAEKASNQRNAAGDEARRLRAQLEHAQQELEAAAAAATAVRRRISSAGGGASSNNYPETSTRRTTPTLSGYFSDSTEQESASTEFTAHQQPTRDTQQLLARLEAAECDRAELQLIAQQHAEAADTLRDRCNYLESQLSESLKRPESADAAPDSSCGTTGSPCSRASPAVEEGKRSPATHQATASVQAHSPPNSTEDKSHSLKDITHEHAALEATARRLDATLLECMQQLQAVTAELQESRRHAAAAQSELHARDSELSACKDALSAISKERDELRSQVAAAQQEAAQHANRLGTALRAEREAAAGDFDALKGELQTLSVSYQEASKKLMTAQRYREEALQAADLAATRAAFHEQMARAKEAELEEAATAQRNLLEENRSMQAAIIQLQRDVSTRACEVQVGSERAAAALQRRVAAAEGGVAVLQARLTDAHTQSESLHHRLEVEQRRIEELEALLAEERAKQCRRELSSQNAGNGDISASGVESEALSQRLAHAEEQCLILQNERAALRAEMDDLQARMMADSTPDAHADILAELAQAQARLQEERTYREQTQEALRAVLHDVRAQGGEPGGGTGCGGTGGVSAPAAPSLTQPAVESGSSVQDVVQRLQFIAEGLYGLGERHLASN